MTILPDFLHHSLARRLGWTLLHSLWQGALVAVLFGLLRFALRRASANARYLAGCLSLLLLVAAPAITLSRMGTGTDPALVRGHAGDSGVVLAGPNSSHALKVGNRASLLILRGTAFLERMVPWLVGAWFAGVMLCSVRLAQGCWRIKCWKAAGSELDSAWVDRLSDVKRRLNVSRPVRLLKSAAVEVPTVIGWLRPVILLPASSLTGLTPSQLEGILAHELAHIRRHDYLVNAFQNVLETVMFYHPAVWWISRCVRDERELCCDDLVVKVCGNRAGYARALATMEELRPATPRLAFAAAGGSLFNRIRRLAGLPSEDEFGWRQFGGVALLGIGLVLAVAGVALMLAPVRYQAITQIRIEPDTTHQLESSDGKIKLSYDPYGLQTEVEVIGSAPVLSPVIETLHLREEWGKRSASSSALSREKTLALLTQKVRVQAVPNTSLANIQVWSEDPKEAAQIADEIARSYREQKKAVGTENILQSIRAMDQQLKQQAEEIRAAADHLERMRVSLGISDPDPTFILPAPTLSVEVTRQLQNQAVLLKDDVVFQETRLRKLTALSRSQLREALQTALATPDSSLASLVSELDLAEQKIQWLSKDFTAQHPSMITASNVVKDLNEKIDRRIEGILLGLETRLDATRARVQELDARLDYARTNDLAVAERTRPYYATKRQIMELIKLKTELGMKVASEQTDLMLPKAATVGIVQPATVPTQPASPNRILATTLIGVGVLLGIAGLVTLKRARVRVINVRGG